KNTRKITERAAYVWGLTGTPSPNGLVDLWAQIALLDSGKRLGRTLTAFRQAYFTPGRQISTGVVVEWNLRHGAAEQIEQKISDICLSMSSADYLELPPVTFNRVEIGLSPKARKAYDSMLATLVAQVESGQTHTAANAAVLTGKLSQITAGALYHDEDTSAWDTLDSAKIDAVTEIVEGTGSPVLVFYRFKSEKARLLEALPGARS